MLFGKRFGRVLERVFGGFWASKVGFGGFDKESNFEAEVGSRQSGSRAKRGESKDALIGPNNDR